MKNLLRFIIHVQLILFAHKAFGLVTEDFASPTQLEALISQCSNNANPVTCYENGLRILMGDSTHGELPGLSEALEQPGFTIHGYANGQGVVIYAETQEEFRHKCLDQTARALPQIIHSARLILKGEVVYRIFEGDKSSNDIGACQAIEKALLENGLEDMGLPTLGISVRFAFNHRGKEEGLYKSTIVNNLSELHQECVAHFHSQNFEDAKADYTTFEVNGSGLQERFNKKSFWRASEICDEVVNGVKESAPHILD